MNRNRLVSRSRVAACLAAIVTASCTVLSAVPALAASKCPVCKLAVLDDTATQDNKVTLKHGAHQVEYRCLYCAIYQANNNFKGNLTITAPTETKGKRVTLTRKGEKWTAVPANAVYVAAEVEHKHCQTGYRALSSKAAYDAFVKKNRVVLRSGKPKPLNLAQMIEASK